MQVATSASATEEDASEEERLVIATEDASEEARLMHQQRERLLEEKAKKKVRDLCLNVVMACALTRSNHPHRFSGSRSYKKNLNIRGTSRQLVTQIGDHRLVVRGSTRTDRNVSFITASHGCMFDKLFDTSRPTSASIR
jgi:hypothetical protein